MEPRNANTIAVHLMIQAIQSKLADARATDDAMHRGRLIGAVIRRLDNLAKRVDPARFGSKGGNKTAERGPDYFRQIAAMRKTRAGGRSKKQPASE